MIIIVDIKKRIKDLKTKYKEVNKDLEDKFNTNSSDIDLLDTRISTLRSDYNNIKKDYSDLSLKIDENKIEFEKMKKEKENLEKKIEEQNNNINELNIEINELKEKLDKEIKNNKDLIQKEKQKEIICKNSFDNFNNNINEKIIDEFKIIISIIKSFYFLKIENNDFNDFILKHLYTYINEFVDNFIDYNEIYLDLFNKEKQIIINKYNKIKIDYLNIIVIGKEGSGKSTLINELLNLKGDKMAEEGRKYTTTKEIKKYISEEEGINKIRIYDTPGSGFTKDLDSMLEDVNILVNLKENNNNIIFYCEKVENERFNEEEVLTIKKIMGLYGDYDLPVIIVLTKSWEKNDSKTKKNDIKENLNEFLKEPKLINKIGIVNVLARDIVKSNTNYSSYGLDELLKQAFDMKNKSGNIISEMKSKLEQDMKKLEIDFISNKTEELDEIIKNENDYFNLIISKKDTNNYNYLENKSWDNYLKEKIKQIYKILNNISNNNKIKRDFIIYLDKKVKDLSKMITPLYNILYNLLEKYSSIYYFTYMEKEQIKLNEKYQTNNKIENLEEKEKKLKDILYNIFNKEFYESFTCGIIKIFLII